MCIKKQEGVITSNQSHDIYIKIDKDFIGDAEVLRYSGHLSNFKT